MVMRISTLAAVDVSNDHLAAIWSAASRKPSRIAFITASLMMACISSASSIAEARSRQALTSSFAIGAAEGAVCMGIGVTFRRRIMPPGTVVLVASLRSRYHMSYTAVIRLDD